MSAKAISSLRLINFITGISDGLMLPMAAYIIAMAYFEEERGYSALLTGFIVSSSGALVFGLARFLGEREEIHHHHPELAATEARREAELMQAIDIDPVVSRQVQAQIQEEKERWLQEVKENDLGWEVYDAARARKSGWQTALGFGSGGFLISFLLFAVNGIWGMPALAIAAGLCTFYSFGWYKGILLGKNALRSAILQLAAGLMITFLAITIALVIFVSRHGAAPLFSGGPAA